MSVPDWLLVALALLALALAFAMFGHWLAFVFIVGLVAGLAIATYG